MKVFIGLTEVAGYCAGLKTGLHRLGVGCTFIDLNGHPFHYAGNDKPTGLIRWATWLGERRARAGSMSGRVLWKAVQEVLKPLLFLWAVRRHDAFIFVYGSTFLHYIDLPILKFLRKKIIYVFVGSDSRPPYMDGFVFPVDQDIRVRERINAARRAKRAIRSIERYADVIVNQPTTGQFHERAFASGLLIGFPLAQKAGEPAGVPRTSPGAVRILHAPSKPRGKGTVAIRGAIESLKRKGHRIEFVEITGQPHAAVRRELARCDFVVDQLYSDTPMAGFAGEAATFAKPAVVGGYYAEMISRDVPSEAVPPSQYCHPNDVERAIETLITDAAYRRELGAKAQAFVTEMWSPEQVAARYLRLLEGDIPAEWMYEPAGIRYVHGCGLPEDRARELVATVLEVGGTAALQINDKPELEAAFVEFACGDRRAHPTTSGAT